MAKSQKRNGREVRKPKQEKIPPAAATFLTRGIGATPAKPTGGAKKS